MDAERVLESFDGDESEHGLDFAEGQHPVQIRSRIDQIAHGEVTEEQQLIEVALPGHRLTDVVENRRARHGQAGRRVDDRIGEIVEAQPVERATELLEQHVGQHRTSRRDVAEGHVVERHQIGNGLAGGFDR